MKTAGVGLIRAGKLLSTLVLLLVSMNAAFGQSRIGRQEIRKAQGKVVPSASHRAKATLPGSTLVFPSLQHNAEFSTRIGIVNIGSETTTVTLSFYNDAGEQALDPVSVDLDPMERYYQPVSTEPAPDVRWAMAASGGSLAGYINTVSRAQDRSMFVRASKTGEIKLYIPHIAENTDEWQTNSSIVNISEDSDANVFFDYLTGDIALEGPIKPFSQYSFDWYLDVFGGTFPEEMPYWGSLLNLTGASLAGMESFTRRAEQVYQICGLNFTANTSSKLYFSHIAKNVNYWWTGLAIESLSSVEVDVTFTPYNETGEELTSVVYRMSPNEKLVKVAGDFWNDSGVAYPEDTAWITVESSNGRLTGYELFGTLPSSGNRLLAAIHAPSKGFPALLYPHIESSDEFWTGLVALNTGDMTGELTATAYDESGKELLTEIVKADLMPKQKHVVLAGSVFSTGLPEGTATIVFSCDQPIIGFELWGDNNPQNYISGMLAEPMPALVYQEGFENVIPLQYPSSGSSDDWMIVKMPDDEDGDWGWDHASLIGFDDGSFYNERWPQIVPFGYDYLVGFYGSQQGASYLRNHELIISPVISLPESVTTLSFFSQFGWASFYSDQDTLYVTEDSLVTGPSILDHGQVLYSPTSPEVNTLPLSEEMGVVEQGFTQWYPVEIDVSAYAGKTVRFIFEINSAFEESWHIDQIEIR